MNKNLFWIASLALGMAACSDADLKNAAQEDNNSVENTASNLKTVKLKSIAASQGRYSVIPSTRADEENGLTLIAEIDNLSKNPGISGFEVEDRYLSATCVYYHPLTEQYYVTYHMQGNNYNTTQVNETGGYIETFRLTKNDGEGIEYIPTPGNIFMAADPSKLSFDFNHLLFDQIPNVSEITPGGMTMDYVGDYTVDGFRGNRIIAVGHSSEPSTSGTEPNTHAIIARLNLESSNPTIDYKIVYTGDKITDEDILKNDGTLMPLGDEDAHDVNCVVRKYNHYYLATRKGIAVLKANENNLFDPEVDINDKIYFLKTPGSAKYLSQPTFTSGIDILYLTKDTPENGLTAETSSPAEVVELAIDTRDGKDLPQDFSSVDKFSWDLLTTSTSPNKKRLGSPVESISPVDGKNMMVASSNNTGAIYVCCGKNGLYVHNPTYGYNQEEYIKFTDAKDGTGSRPVNGVFVEDWDAVDGHHYTDGFIYVANGACLTILDAKTLEQVAEFSAFKEGDASANFVHVVRTNDYTNENVPDRIITVAYGQAGVKVFRFVPPTK